MTRAHRFIVTLILVLFCSTTYSQTYTWKDKNGGVHFGDSPPANQENLQVKSITIKEKNPAGNVDEAVQRRKARQADLLHDFEESSRQRKEEKAKKRALKNKKEQLCKRAKNRVKHNKRYSLIYYEGGDGEHNYLDDKQRKEYDQKLQEEVKKHCS